MKIVGKKKDYYDYVCQYSPEPLWVREEREINLDPTKKSILSYQQCEYLSNTFNKLPLNRFNKLPSINKKLLGYCGVLIPLYFFEHIDIKEKTTMLCFNNIDAVINKWNDLYSKKNKYVMKYNENFFGYSFSPRGLVDWTNNHITNKDITDIFISLKSPLFIIKRTNIHQDRGYNTSGLSMTVNPNLRENGIQRLLNPFNVYQDIERYIGNDLVMCNQIIPDFGDELKRDAHGMDKWSFKNKTCPKKRKQKR